MFLKRALIVVHKGNGHARPKEEKERERFFSIFVF
jgi:hypothetical protein